MIEDDPSDEKSPVSYRLAMTEDDEGNVGYELAVFNSEKELDHEEFCREVEYFLKHAREDDYSVFKALDGADSKLH